jgi:hypothetical protein
MENKYHPLTEEQFIGLRDLIQSIGAYLPENKASYVWNMYNQLRDERETQPCMCGSAGGHWKRAMDFLYHWVKERT